MRYVARPRLASWLITTCLVFAEAGAAPSDEPTGTLWTAPTPEHPTSQPPPTARESNDGGSVPLDAPVKARHDNRECDAAPAVPSEEPGAPTGSAAAPLTAYGKTYPLGPGLRIRTFPADHLYPRYLANPRGAFVQAQLLRTLRSDTGTVGNQLAHVTMGGRLRLFRLHSPEHPERGLQFSIEAAFLGRFDTTASLDAIGWDGVYAFMAAYKLSESFSVKLAQQHDSAHVADEYIEKTGRERLTYTREEINFGARYDLLDYGGVYAEIGRAIHLGNPELMRPWRLETGLELRLGALYAALDETLFEDDGFRLNTTAQLGLMTQVADTGQRYGIGLQFESGRSVLGEFFQDRMRSVGAGVWADL